MTIFVFVWTVAALGWWLIALGLLLWGSRSNHAPSSATRALITVFKPLPPVRDEQERAAIAEGIGSFIGQLRSGDEILVGLDITDGVGWAAVIKCWRATWPSARILVVAQKVPCQCANPKIAWLQVLAPSARGEVWLWSDADVTAPPGFLNEICAQLAASGSNAVTAPYKIQHIREGNGILDALFVNVEFLPGALLLGRLGRSDFAYGAATVFRAETFHARGDWHKLGAALADDHKLGELLQPVTLAGTLVSTFTKPAGWRDAWQHYYRWQKTVRWCRPGGYAALLMVLPVFGWMLAALVGDCQAFFLSGLVIVLVGEMLVAVLACWLVGCRLPPATWLGVMLWPLVRMVTWIFVWLPIPVLWSGRQRKWFAPQQG